MTDDFPSVIFFFSEDHILLEIEMLLEFIPVRLFLCHLDHRVLIKILKSEEFSLFENSVRNLDFLMLNTLLRLMNAFHLQMSVHFFFLPSLVVLIFNHTMLI